MSPRLSKIYTRTGDRGTTRLGNGSQVPKNNLRVEAYGTLDELNSALGLLLTYELPDAIYTSLTEIQHDLFDLGGELSIPGHSVLKPGRVTTLEKILDALNTDLTPLDEFILPGGTRASSVCHLARTVCRRAERIVVALSQDEQIEEVSIQYLNRLSDLLFVMARSINKAAGSVDVLWQQKRRAE